MYMHEIFYDWAKLQSNSQVHSVAEKFEQNDLQLQVPKVTGTLTGSSEKYEKKYSGNRFRYVICNELTQRRSSYCWVLSCGL